MAYSRRYARVAVVEFGFDVNLDRSVGWRVSGRAKRRAAAVKHPKVPGAAVGEPMDWDRARREHTDALDRSRFEDLHACEIVCSRRAVDAYDEAEWRRTLRHELVHVEQFQRFGATGHGAWFRRRAESVDTENHCPAFHRGRYLVRCRDCREVRFDRCRECETTRLAELPPSKQASRVRPTACCGAYYELEDTRAD
ncbi:SprT-like domain-containing protein [Halorarum halophilum]|uniref:SprT-like domain-containing protein n=1 Tax=Halorarum halophilum TaxID=2743090 RepID=A0A7D5KEQ6_9EURY|nr:SprT-like domain-containing protein [Halobaculum halophilum]QLG27016.1 SprT-like domain-containing protein [Halobaculum halophilum]